MTVTPIASIPRGILRAAIWASVMLAMGGAMAAPSDCYAIKDGDKRAYCQAVVKRDYGHCYRIKDGDKRNQCMAETRGQRGNCYAIKEQDARKACLAQSRK